MHPFCVYRNITMLHKKVHRNTSNKDHEKVTAAQNNFLKIPLRVEIVLITIIKKQLLVLQIGVFSSTLHNFLIFKIKLNRVIKRYIKPKLSYIF